MGARGTAPCGGVTPMAKVPRPMIARSKQPTSRVRMTTNEVVVVLEAMRGDFRVFGEALQSVREDVRVLKEDVGVLKQDVRALKEDVGVLKEDVRVLKQDVGVLKHDMILVKDAVLENTREIKRLGTLTVDRDEVEGMIAEAIHRRG